MEGGAGDERHHGGRGSPPPSVPGHPDRGPDAANGHVDPFAPARRRDVGHLLRGAARSVHHRRGLRGAPPGRRRGRRPAHATRRPVRSGVRRAGGQPGLHPYLDGPVRSLVVGRAPGDAAGADAAPTIGTAQHLRLRVLGSPDGGGPHRDQRPPAGPVHPGDHRRAPERGPSRPPAGQPMGEAVPAARSSAARLRAQAHRRPAQAGPPAGRAVDRPTPGVRRVLGWDPAALGLLADGAPPAGLPARPSGDASRAGRAGRVHHRRRGRPAARGVPVPGVGHGVGCHCAVRRGHAGHRPGHGSRWSMAAGRRGDHQGRLEHPASPPRPGGMGVRVRQRPLPRHRRHGRGGAGPSALRRGRRGGHRPGRGLDRGDAVR